MASKTEGESSTMTISAAVLNETHFAACYDKLNASTLKLTEFSNTEAVGTILCDRAGLLYTSIPQNGNWYAEVDGNKVDTIEVGGAMVAVALSEGEHEVRFYYHNSAFALGWKISLACVAVFAALIWKNSRHEPKAGKFGNKKKEKH